MRIHTNGSECAGAYVVQAAIADPHVRQPRDWEQIALLCRRLEELTDSRVTVNRAIAVAELSDTSGRHSNPA